MRGSRSGLPKTATAVVLSAGVGLLVMHALSIPDVGSEMQGHAEQAATMLVSVASSNAGMNAADPEMRGHDHELLGCLWLLVAGLAFLIAQALTRQRAKSRDPVAVIRKSLSATQRAPPTSVRLSLLGVSRR